jgi:hypothetical protein
VRLLLGLALFLLTSAGAKAMQTSPAAPLSQAQMDRIGHLLIEAGPPHGRLLLIGEFDDGYMSSRLLWQAPGAASVVDQPDVSPELFNRIFTAAIETWEQASRGGARWTLMAFLVEDGHFSVRVARPQGPMTGRFDRFSNAEVARAFPGLPLMATRLPVAPPPPVRSAVEAVPTPADIERIRTGLLAVAGRPDAKIVLFAWFEANRAASAIRYRINGESEVRAGFFPVALDPACQKSGRRRISEWARMCGMKCWSSSKTAWRTLACVSRSTPISMAASIGRRPSWNTRRSGAADLQK